MLSRDCLLQCRARALSLGHHYVNCPHSNEETKSCSCYFSGLAPGHFNRHQAQRRIHHFPPVLRHLIEELLLLFGSMKEMSPYKSVCPGELTGEVFNFTLLQQFGQSHQIILYHGQRREPWYFTEFTGEDAMHTTGVMN